MALISTDSNSSYSSDNDYGYALFRDELKAQRLQPRYFD